MRHHNNNTALEGKDTAFNNQMKVVYNFLKDNVCTASEIEERTGIKQKNITRYKRTLQKANQLWVVCKKHCRITGFRAEYLTTDESKVPTDPQLKLFQV